VRAPPGSERAQRAPASTIGRVREPAFALRFVTSIARFSFYDPPLAEPTEREIDHRVGNGVGAEGLEPLAAVSSRSHCPSRVRGDFARDEGRLGRGHVAPSSFAATSKPSRSVPQAGPTSRGSVSRRAYRFYSCDGASDIGFALTG
jgi:hypothetical protein